MRKALPFVLIGVIIIIVGVLISQNLIKEGELIPKKRMVMLENVLENKKLVMIIAFRDFRDEEYFVPKEIFETAGAIVTTASTQKGKAVGTDGGEAEVDLLVSQINPFHYEAVIFIGGPGCLSELDNEDSYKVAQETISQNKVLAAICVSPVILAKAGVLEGKKATVWSSLMDKSSIKILEENGAIYQNEPVVTDGNIITGNGPGAAQKFGATVVEVLTEK